jgi:hypothetical protein
MTLEAVNALNKILKIWAQVLNHARIRDRTVKAMQYGCQMVMGYYGSQLQEDVRNMLTVTRRTASTSRRAFWLLKSFNHIGTFIELLMDLQKSFTFTKFFELTEQFFLIIFFYFENIIFLIRINLVTTIKEADLENYINWSGLGGDIAGFLAAAVTWIYRLLDWRNLRNLLLANRHLLADRETRLEQEEIKAKMDFLDTTISLVVVSVFLFLEFNLLIL